MVSDSGYILDTNAYYGLTGNDENIQKKFNSISSSKVHLCEIVIVEILRRRISTIEKAIKDATHGKSLVVVAYKGLLRDLDNIKRFKIANYDADADVIFESFSKKPKSPAVNDCRIAATARRHGLKVVSRNYQHLSVLLRDNEIDDWSLSPNPLEVHP